MSIEFSDMVPLSSDDDSDGEDDLYDRTVLARQKLAMKRNKVKKRTSDGDLKTAKLMEKQKTHFREEKVEDWDSEVDLSFDSEDFDESAIVAASSNRKNDRDYEDFVDHYLSVCKSKGYDLETVPPPPNMKWSHETWIKRYPKEKYILMEKVLKEQVLPVIKDKTGKDLELVQIQAINVWFYMGLYFFITFEARDKNDNNNKQVYQTRFIGCLSFD